MSTKPPSRSPIPVQRATRELAANLKAWRKLTGLTQNQLADRANIDRKTVIRVEQGDPGVSTGSVLRILHALGVLEGVVRASDPYETDLGRLRADESLPARVRPRNLGPGDG